jgi:hypothetical protein
VADAAAAQPVSTAPEPTAHPKPKPGAGGYDISKPAGKCAVSGRTIEPTEKFMTALRDTPQGFQRLDVAQENWDAFDKSDLLGFWQTTMPRPEEKKKLFVDDAILVELFERLEGTDEPSRQNFRFVLGLILMRKRLVIYDTSKTDDAGREVWLMRIKGRGETTFNLINPHLREEQVADVSRQLGEILNEGA